MTSQEIFDAVLPLHQQLVELRDRAKGVAPTWQLSKSRTAWQIEEYDGYEHVAEKHRTWRARPN